jgi:N-acetylglucosaminyl-diphospho-decaprenol L-rhamnosyltransferase
MTEHEHQPEPASSDTMDVAVVVVTYNSARHLASLGDALSSGSVVPARMLVVDNASADDTVDRALSAGFEVLETGSNKGFGAGCNAGLNAVSNEFVLFCNPDVKPAPDSLNRLLAALNATSTAAIAGAAFDEPFPARRFIRITGQMVGFLPKSVSRRFPFRRYECRLPVDQSQERVVVDYAVGAFILCRVAALRSVGGFDERFFLYFEEDDLARRLNERGWLTLLVPGAHVEHEHNASSEGFDGPMMTPFRIHSAYLYYRKHHSRVYAEFARVILAVGVTLDRMFRSFAGRRQVYGASTAVAPFRTIEAIRRDHERDISGRAT